MMNSKYFMLLRSNRNAAVLKEPCVKPTLWLVMQCLLIGICCVSAQLKRSNITD